MDESPDLPTAHEDNPGQSDQVLYERIWLALRDEKISLGTDLKRLNHPSSPVFKRSDNLLPWIAVIMLAIAGYRIAGWIGLVAVAASMAILMMTTISIAVLSRVRKRAVEIALSGKDGFETLWQYGGLTVMLPGNRESEVQSPDGDWRAFARKHLPPAESELEG